jgi:hypothetical protein
LPLSEKARVEVYLPDLPTSAYELLLQALEQEFTYTFGGCTTIGGLDGSYLSRFGVKIRDRINLIYTDAPFAFDENFARLSRYADELRAAAFEALDEETVLICRTDCLPRRVRKPLSSCGRHRCARAFVTQHRGSGVFNRACVGAIMLKH